MPVLFNQPNSDSLLDVIKKEVNKIGIKQREGWVFYAITCYFEVKAIQNLLKEVQKELENNLSGIRILVDDKEWIKSREDISTLKTKLSEDTGLQTSSISFTPISYSGRLFHAKSYALINQDNKKGFVIVTSANLTNAGIEYNIEIGQIVYDSTSLIEFFKLFSDIENNHPVPPELDEKQRELQLAVQFLSKGVFYHHWDYKPDLTVRLELSNEEKKRLKELTNNEETLKKIEDFKLKQPKKITKKPIDIRSIFSFCPKPIPSEIWRSYSIDTPLGKWIPSGISELIDKEVMQSRQIFNIILDDICNDNNIQKEAEKLNDSINTKLKNNIIDYSSDSWNAVESWKQKIKRFLKDDNLRNIFFCEYEKIDLSIQQLEHDLIISVYERIKEFYYSPDNHRVLGRTIASINLNNHSESISLEIDDNLPDWITKIKEMFKKHRLGELEETIYGDNQNKKIKEGDEFTAFILYPGKIEYERLDGTFVEVRKPNNNPLLFYITKDKRKIFIPVELIKRFKKTTNTKK